MYHATSARNDSSSSSGIKVFKTRVIVSIDQRWAAPRQKTKYQERQNNHKVGSSLPTTVTRWLQRCTARITVPTSPHGSVAKDHLRHIIRLLGQVLWLLIDEKGGNRTPVSLYNHDQLDFGSPISSERTTIDCIAPKASGRLV